MVPYRPDKEVHIADTFSGSSVRDQKELEVNMVPPQLPMSEPKLQKFQKAEDPELQLPKDMTLRGDR